ncbi:Spy/CpxP family protein refolding chaperone [Candidatus Caldatribacterium sp.]|uniref:Spy/CpxP family protein refolding chaperone n=1 Tax=Candidatus Caldatribacterium sp. TaxID=2282143 RepID=UPI0029982A7C|nr:periplasmic heavy metal sensor [Candidatus Caldatribacterium sp.]MDW8081044.1 periplasmic heavy metal sensor [Candidatus Calescibacterium sp.]
MKRKVLSVVFAAAVIFFTTALAFAGPHSDHSGKGPWDVRGGRCPRFLPGFWSTNLSEEQRAKILEIEKNFVTQEANLEAQIRAKILELRELQLKEASEENAKNIRAKIDEILALQQELFALKKDIVQQILSVLTPEQLKNLPPFGWGMGRMCS